MENANKLSSKKDNQTSYQEVVNTAFINNQLPQVETPTKLVLSKLPFIFFTLLVLVFLLVLAEIFPYKKMEDTKIQLKYIKIFPKPTLITQQPQQQKSKQWVLKKKINGGFQTIISFCRNCYGSYLEHWKEWIFYPEYENKNNRTNIQIKGYNLKTSESKIIYDLNQSINDFQGKGKGLPREVSDMQVINNTLFFSLGGYLTPGGVFWVDLPPSTKPQKLLDGPNAKITYWKNRYWIIRGEGDFCWGIRDYSLVDITSKKITHIARSNMGCIEGEELIDIDKRERMILAFHSRGSIHSDNNGIYQYVTGVSLLDPSVKEEIIAKQNMPSDITSIKYLEKSDQLLLLGKEKYLYDFSSKTIKKTEMVLPSPTPEHEIQNYIDDKIKKLNLPNEYEFVLE